MSPVNARLPQVHGGHPLVDWIALCSGAAVGLHMCSHDDLNDDDRAFQLVADTILYNGANTHALNRYSEAKAPDAACRS